MRTHRAQGFTLVEILIVVVILGILAAIVVPQFTSASQDAVKGALKSQIQTITAQTELYRVQNFGRLPHDPGEADPVVPGAAGGGTGAGGWGILVNGQFLKGEPINGFTGSSFIDTFQPAAVGTVITMNVGAGGAPLADGQSPGWIYNPTLGSWAANGFNPTLNLLSIETTTTPAYIDPSW